MPSLEEYAHHVERAAAGDDDSARLLRKFITEHAWVFPLETLIQVSRTILHCRRGDERCD